MKVILKYTKKKTIKKIKIGKQIFKIISCNNLRANKKSLGGFVAHKERIIYLNRKAKSPRGFIILHEIFHNIFYQMEKGTRLNFFTRRKVASLRNNEEFIDCLALYFYFLIDRKDLLKLTPKQ